jgi:hypothetical protein
MAYTKVKPLMVASFPSSRLTGAFGAISGANLTGLGDGIDTKDASNDPTISTNPATGVGTVWLNKSTGELFNCTDATAGANVWLNVGGGSGDVWRYQGAIAGYTAGGCITTADNSYINRIDKYNFAASMSRTTDVGNLSVAKFRNLGTHSSTHGFSVGGSTTAPVSGYINTIEKYSFSSDGDASDNGDLAIAYGQGGTTSSRTHGYVFHGALVGGTGAGDAKHQKHQFATSANAERLGDLQVTRYASAGNSDLHAGYSVGGYSTAYGAPNTKGEIYKHSYSSGSSSNIKTGDLAAPKSSGPGNGVSSTTHGYAMGGYNEPSISSNYEKYSFASNSNGTSVGNLTGTRYGNSGWSSTTHGYTGGGVQPGSSPVMQSGIDQFAFASGGNMTDIGDLTTAIDSAATTHV